LHLKDSLNYPNGTSQPSWIKGEIESIICSSSTGRVTALHLWSVRNQELGENRKHILIIETTKDDLLFFF